MNGGGEPLLDGARRVKKYFPIKEGMLIQREVARVQAVDGVSLEVRRARPSGWSASRAAASRRSGAASCGCTS